MSFFKLKQSKNAPYITDKGNFKESNDQVTRSVIVCQKALF